MNLLWERSGVQVELGEGDETSQIRKPSTEGNLELSVKPLHNSVRLRVERSCWRVNYAQEFTQGRPN